MAVRWWTTVLQKLGLPSGPGRTLRARIEAELEAAEIRALSGDAPRPPGNFQQVETIHGAYGAGMRVRYRLVFAETMREAGRLDYARAALDEARDLLAGLDAAARPALEARLVAQTLLSLSADEVTDTHLAEAAAAVAGPRLERPADRLRQIYAAHWLGQILHRHGDWNRARRFLELATTLAQTVNAAEAPPPHWTRDALDQLWARARQSGSAAARHIAEVLASLGDREGASAWYGVMAGMLEGARQPAARLARAHALATRAAADPLEGIEAASVRAVRFEQALAEAVALEPAAGHVLAADIEISLARLHAEMGNHERIPALLESAIAHAAGSGDSDGVALEARASLALAEHFENECDEVGARRVLDAIRKRWEADRDPALRYAAAVALVQLHRLLEGPEHLERARGLLDRLEAMIPGLLTAHRAVMRAALLRERGVQLEREERIGPAIETLTEAVAAAEAVPGSERGGLIQHAEMRLAILLAGAGRQAEADSHFTAALAVPEIPGDAASPIGRANILLHRARNRHELDRTREAVDDLRKAHLTGRDSGSAAGRLTAATAAMALGDLEADDAERRRHYEAAARLGRLSGRKEGLDVAEIADKRLKGNIE